MPLDLLLKRLEGFLHAEQEWVQCTPEDANRASRAAVRRDALAELGSALENYQTALAGNKGIRRVLVAVDGTEPSGWAVASAVRLANELGGKIALVHVLTEDVAFTPEFGFAESGVLCQQHREQAELILQQMKARIPASLLDCAMLKEGDPMGQIVATAKEWNADLIVLGTHGRGAVAHFLLGSTAESVVRHAHCPVLTVGHDSSAMKPPGCTCASGKCCAASKAAQAAKARGVGAALKA